MAKTRQDFTDETILSWLREGGARADEAIRILYRNHYTLLSQYVITNSGLAEDAEDIFQDVIITFVNLVSAGKFRGESNIQTFLYSLNRNIWLNELKRKSRAETRERKYESLVTNAESDIHSAMEYRQTTHELMHVIDQLGEVCKKILLLFYYENKPIREILVTLDYENEQVVRNKKSKCLKRMEELVQNNQQLHQQLKTLMYG